MKGYTAKRLARLRTVLAVRHETLAQICGASCVLRCSRRFCTNCQDSVQKTANGRWFARQWSHTFQDYFSPLDAYDRSSAVAILRASLGSPWGMRRLYRRLLPGGRWTLESVGTPSSSVCCPMSFSSIRRRSCSRSCFIARSDSFGYLRRFSTRVVTDIGVELGNEKLSLTLPHRLAKALPRRCVDFDVSANLKLVWMLVLRL